MPEAAPKCLTEFEKAPPSLRRNESRDSRFVLRIRECQMATASLHGKGRECLPTHFFELTAAAFVLGKEWASAKKAFHSESTFASLLLTNA
jgi:hypothetical protein